MNFTIEYDCGNWGMGDKNLTLIIISFIFDSTGILHCMHIKVQRFLLFLTKWSLTSGNGSKIEF